MTPEEVSKAISELSPEQRAEFLAVLIMRAPGAMLEQAFRSAKGDPPAGPDEFMGQCDKHGTWFGGKGGECLDCVREQRDEANKTRDTALESLDIERAKNSELRVLVEQHLKVREEAEAEVERLKRIEQQAWDQSQKIEAAILKHVPLGLDAVGDGVDQLFAVIERLNADKEKLRECNEAMRGPVDELRHMLGLHAESEGVVIAKAVSVLRGMWATRRKG